MNKRKIFAGIGILLFLLPVLLFAEGEMESGGEADHYFIFNDGSGNAAVAEKVMPAFADAGLEGWTVQNLAAAGIDFYIFKLAPGAAEYPIHGSPVPWLGYVLSGKGELVLGNADESVASVVPFDKGDFLIFEPDTMHGWRGSSQETQILFLTLK